jgi:hypothetical protein
MTLGKCYALYTLCWILNKNSTFQKSIAQLPSAQLAAVILMAENAAEPGLLKSAPLSFYGFSHHAPQGTQ